MYLVVLKGNMVRQINNLVLFHIYSRNLKSESKYCLDNGRYAVPPIRMFKYLLLKPIIFD